MLSDNPWISLLGMLVIVAAVVALAYFFTRYVVGRGWAGSIGMAKKTMGLSVLVQAPVGKDQRLAVIQVGTRYFLVGLTPQNISMLAELTEEEISSLQESQTGQEQSPQGMPFRQAFMDALQRGKKR